MHTIVDLSGLRSIEAQETPSDVPGGPRAGAILVTARQGGNEITIILPREVALSLHRGLDPWARALTEETDHGPTPSCN